MATAQNKSPHAIDVRVLVEGRYNGADHKSLGHQPVGAIIPVAAGWYADELIRLGLVERYVEPEPEPELEPEAVDAEPAPAKPARKRKGK